MDINFVPTITQDGSIGLFNIEVDDIYHSSYGAYNEALEKFIRPSKLTEFIKSNSSVKILDICYGMGYNTKAAIKTCLSANPNCSISVDCLEIDSNVFAFSFLAKENLFGFNVLEYLDDNSSDMHEIIDSIYKILENDSFLNYTDSEIASFFVSNKKEIYKDLATSEINGSLHNIYYRYISNRNIQKDGKAPKGTKISLIPYLGDARNMLRGLEGTYDFIFLDAFTPTKLPTLWSVQFFSELNRLLSPKGNITTYSNSAAVRNGMIQAGFFVGKTEKGTIAFKDKSLLINPLDEKSLGLLKTRAGIPFFDKNLNSTAEDILALRKKMVTESDLQSSSKFLKNYTKNK